MKNNIALIVTYFGKLPLWLPAFQLSCKYNPDIQWIIFSDQLAPKHCPDNIEFIKISINDFVVLVADKLGIKEAISDKFLYKICDFKPAFGLIFQEYLYAYDFWGHCDLDIVWGRIRNFITENILSNCEIISSRPERISGHFCLYRNIETINNIFMSMPWTKNKLMISDKYMQLDEEYLTRYLHWLIDPTFLSRVKQFFYGKPYVPKIYWDKVLTTSGEQQRQLLVQPGQHLRWNQGHVYNAEGRELMYLHFHVLKKTIESIDFGYSDEPKEFVITSTQIKQFNESAYI